jgi:protein SCO1/2
MTKYLYCFVLALLALTVAFVTGCGDASPKAPKAAKEYSIKGTVTAIGAENKMVTLDHDDVPGVMQAMEMAFPVSDPNVLDGIAVGDAVEGRLQKSDELIITRLQKR